METDTCVATDRKERESAHTCWKKNLKGRGSELGSKLGSGVVRAIHTGRGKRGGEREGGRGEREGERGREGSTEGKRGRDDSRDPRQTAVAEVT
jgi:hypothetical protein